MFDEALKEVFRTLTPGACQWDTYKTNEGDAVGSKVILRGYISPDYRGGFKVSYHSWAEQGIQAIDNVFHLLDGKGVSKDSSRNNFRLLHLIFRSSWAVPHSRNPQRRIATPPVPLNRSQLNLT